MLTESHKICPENKMFSLSSVLIILVGVDAIGTGMCYSGGGVQESCQTMKPNHGHGLTNGLRPFKVTPEMVFLEKVEMMTIVLEATSSTRFTGFLLEARESKDGPPVGSFTLVNTKLSRLLDCNGNPNAAVTQTNNRDKNYIQVNWTPQKAGLFYFRVTFIQDMRTYWMPEDIEDITILVTIHHEQSQKHWHKAFKFLLCPLSMAANVFAFIILLLSQAAHMTLVALVGVAMILSLAQSIIFFLPFGPSHELRSISVWVFRAIAFTTEVFTMAAIFVFLAQMEKVCSIRWPMKLMGGYMASMVLFYILFLIKYWNHRKRCSIFDVVTKKTTALEDCFTAILVLAYGGFTGALIVAIYSC
ncbi:hypothetical protein DPEC_G00269730 [Dallia pectoralis]|uniref:Uncharacterized protein n=1 Tax=Dallia pectoralis TaxID=75939 RepID=A0ACC2FPD8_DALPE|nr:hypothetical protein DPEC_G00269730 [Dallia pectoralis]